MTWFILLVLIVAVLALFLSQARVAAQRRRTDPTEQMDADSRSLYIPVRRLVGEIEGIAKKQDSVTARVLGTEAVQEARRIQEQCGRALVARTELKRAGRGRSVAERDIADLGQKAEVAQSDGEKQALLSAQEARQLELKHYETVSETLGRIDSGVRQAEAALSEMKARLSVAASSEKAAASEGDDLRETIGRLKSLSVSYDEAEQMLRQ